MIPINQIYLGDCLEWMEYIDNKSIDMVLCDLPYGITQCKWDTIIPFEPLWNQYKRIIKDNGCIALFSTEPFTSLLISSQISLFKYKWTWDKVNRPTGFLNAKKQPLRITEDICIFYKKQPIYNPIMRKGKPYRAITGGTTKNYRDQRKSEIVTVCNGDRYPNNIVRIRADVKGSEGRLVPTQKPVKLFKYFIKTYTNSSDTVLDNCIGSGTCAIASIELGRNYLGFELDEDTYNIAKERIEGHKQGIK